MFALLSLVQYPGISSLWIHPAFSVPEHEMFLSYHGYKTQCSHYSVSFNIQAYPLSGFILRFHPGFIKCFYYTMFFVLLKVFCIRRRRKFTVGIIVAETAGCVSDISVQFNTFLYYTSFVFFLQVLYFYNPQICA